jgi:hypothetical protein
MGSLGAANEVYDMVANKMRLAEAAGVGVEVCWWAWWIWGRGFVGRG